MQARQPKPEPEESKVGSPVAERGPALDVRSAVVTRIDARLLFPGWGPKLWK